MRFALWVWRRISDISTAMWLWGGGAAFFAIVLGFLQQQPLALLFVYALGAAAFMMALVRLINPHQSPHSPERREPLPHELDQVPAHARGSGLYVGPGAEATVIGGRMEGNAGHGVVNYGRLQTHDTDFRDNGPKQRAKGDRDTGVARALAYAISGSWDGGSGMGLVFSGGVKLLDQAIETFRRAAEAGELRTWGRREEDGLFVLIEPSFWQSSTLRREALISFMPSARTEPLNDDDAVEYYHGIMVNSFEVERVWPHAG